MNSVHLVGHVGRDPKLEHTTGGTPVCNFSLATKERVKSGDRWEDKTEWHNIRVWKNQAETVAAKCGKGSLVAVTGRITTEEWSKDGQKRTMTRIVADRVEFLSLKAPGARPHQEPVRPDTHRPTNGPAPTGYGSDGYDDEIPF